MIWIERVFMGNFAGFKTPPFMAKFLIPKTALIPGLKPGVFDRAVFVIVVALLIFAVAGGLAFSFSPVGNVIDAGPTGAVVWTKAICDDGNFCVDYEVTCENGRVVRLERSPHSAQFGPGWEDPRPEELRNWWC